MRKVAFDYMWKWESSVSLPAALVIVSDVSCGRCIKSYNLSLQRAVLNGFRIVLSPCDKHRATSGTAALRSVWPIEADAPAQEFHCRGGRVAIGKTSAGFPLDVKGDIMANGWVRTTGAHGWYNQTYAGGWYMDNASWIKAYNKPVYIGFTSLEGANSFGVGLRCYHASHTSVEVQGGSYTMGLGCNSNGSWYWWRGTSSGKGYVMQYNGTLWSFTGEIKSSVGMHSDGYMSCLGKNTGSDARLKDILGDVTLPIDVILGAPAVRFRWNANAGAVMAGKAAVGTIAQYWLEHLTEVVGTMPTGYYGVNYGALDWIAIHSVAKYAKTEIELLKEENRRLKERVAALERRLAA